MEIKDILGRVDHTLLGVTAGWQDIKKILDDAEKYGTASACKYLIFHDANICAINK